MGVAAPWEPVLRWAVGVRDPLKSLVTGSSLPVNCYLENQFHKKLRVNTPPPLMLIQSLENLINIYKKFKFPKFNKRIRYIIQSVLILPKFKH